MDADKEKRKINACSAKGGRGGAGEFALSLARQNAKFINLSSRRSVHVFQPGRDDAKGLRAGNARFRSTLRPRVIFPSGRGFRGAPISVRMTRYHGERLLFSARLCLAVGEFRISNV